MPTIRTVATGSVLVRFKRSVDSTWITAHPLLRIDPSASHNEQDGPTTLVDAFAGSIFDLAPGTQYDVELTHVESGQPTKASIVQRTTRALPEAAGAPNKNATVGGTALQTLFNGLGAGDVLQLAAGTYTVNNLALNNSGTSSSPIIVRGLSKTGVVLLDTAGVVCAIGASNVIIENLTIQGSGVDTGDVNPVSTGIQINGARTNITIRDVVMIGVDQGIASDGSACVGTLVYNCDITGNDAWITGNVQGTSPTGNDTGVELPGTGNCMFQCTLKGFGDGFSFTRYSSDGVFSAGSHAYRNLLRNICDDTQEFDYGSRNIAFYDNLVVNCGTAASIAYIFGGPCYFFRNVCVNVARGPYKFNGQGTGQTGFLIYNNTIVRTDGLTGGWGLNQTGTNGGWWNYSFRNNLLVYRGSASGGLAALEQPGNNPCDFSNNAWFPNGKILWTNSGGSFGNLAAAQASSALNATPVFGTATRRMANDVITVTNPFVNAITLGASHNVEVTATPDATLSASGPKNLGVAIPGITDGFSGVAPDIGAIITGRPGVRYGAAP